MSKNLEALKNAYKTTIGLMAVSQTIEGRSEDKKHERIIYYLGEQQGIELVAWRLLSKKECCEFREFVSYTTRQKGEL